MAARFRQSPDASVSAPSKPRRVTPAHAAHARVDGASPLARQAPILTEIPLNPPAEVGSISSHAPRPIGVDPVATGNFQKITAQDGALMGRTSVHDGFEARSTQSAQVSAQRMDDEHRPNVESHQKKVRVGKAPAIIIGVVAAVVLVLVVMIAINLISGLENRGPEIQDADRIEQTQAAPGELIQYDGYNYVLTQSSEGPWTLVRSSSTNSDPLVLFNFPGTPMGLILYNGAFIIPENLNGSWDVVAWTMGDGSVPALLANEDGSDVSGTGSLTAAALDGDTLVLTLADGSTQDVKLF